MAITLVAAGLAGGGAGLQHLPQRRLAGTCLARREAAGGEADIGAIQVEADALPKLVDRPLGAAGVGEGRAGLGAGVAFLRSEESRVGTACGRTCKSRLSPDAHNKTNPHNSLTNNIH